MSLTSVSSGRTKIRYSYLIALFLLLSLLLNTRYPITKFINGQESHVSFSENDELYYILLSSQISEIPLSVFLHSAVDSSVVSDKTLALTSPYKITLYAFGKAERIFSLSPAQFGYLCDILFTFLALIAFYTLFSIFECGLGAAFFAAIIAVAFPWIFGIQNLGLTPSIEIFGLKLVPYSVDFYACFPSQRFGPTQISVVCMVLSLISLNKYLLRQTPTSKYLLLIVAAILSGLSIYLYIFAFLVSIALGALSIIAITIIRQKNYTSVLKILAIYLVLTLLIATPGLLLLGKGTQIFDASLLPEGILHHMIGYSVEHIIFLLLLTCAAMRSSNQKIKIIFSIMVICLVAHFCLYNLQALTGEIMTPYHFSLFFITPLLSGLVFLYCFSLLTSANTRIILGAVILVKVLLFDAYNQFRSAKLENTQDLELLSYATTLAPSDKIATLPFTKPFGSSVSGIDSVIVMPSLIQLIAKRSVFPSNPALFGDEHLTYKRSFEEELLLGWLFSGTKRLAGSCFDQIDDPVGDLPQGIIYWSYYQRRDFCRYAKYYFNSLNICELFKGSSISHLLLDTTILQESPSNWSKIATPVWKSSQGKFIMLKLDRLAAQTLACEQPVVSFPPFENSI